MEGEGEGCGSSPTFPVGLNRRLPVNGACETILSNGDRLSQLQRDRCCPGLEGGKGHVQGTKISLILGVSAS